MTKMPSTTTRLFDLLIHTLCASSTMFSFLRLVVLGLGVASASRLAVTQKELKVHSEGGLQ